MKSLFSFLILTLAFNSANADDLFSCNSGLTNEIEIKEVPSVSKYISLADLPESIRVQLKNREQSSDVEAAEKNFDITANFIRSLVDTERLIPQDLAIDLGQLMLDQAASYLRAAHIPFTFNDSNQGAPYRAIFFTCDDKPGTPGALAQAMDDREYDCRLGYDPIYLLTHSFGAIFSPEQQMLSIGSADVGDFSFGKPMIQHELFHAWTAAELRHGRVPEDAGSSRATVSSGVLPTDFASANDSYKKFQSHDEPGAYRKSIRRLLKELDLALRLNNGDAVLLLRSIRRQVNISLTTSSRNMKIASTQSTYMSRVRASYAVVNGYFMALIGYALPHPNIPLPEIKTNLPIRSVTPKELELLKDKVASAKNLYPELVPHWGDSTFTFEISADKWVATVIHAPSSLRKRFRFSPNDRDISLLASTFETDTYSALNKMLTRNRKFLNMYLVADGFLKSIEALDVTNLDDIPEIQRLRNRMYLALLTPI